MVQISNEECSELVAVEKKTKSTKALKRIQAFKLMYSGWKYGKIADFLLVTNNTLSNWIKIHKDSGNFSPAYVPIQRRAIKIK